MNTGLFFEVDLEGPDGPETVRVFTHDAQAAMFKARAVVRRRCRQGVDVKFNDVRLSEDVTSPPDGAGLAGP